MKKILLIFTLLFTIIACKKYDENKGIYLKSPEKRLEGIWKWKSNDNIKWTFQNDGKCIREIKHTNGVSFTNNFIYYWNNDKKSIIITYNNGNSQEIKILKLTNKEVHFDYIETKGEDLFLKQ